MFFIYHGNLTLFLNLLHLIHQSDRTFPASSMLGSKIKRSQPSLPPNVASPTESPCKYASQVSQVSGTTPAPEPAVFLGADLKRWFNGRMIIGHLRGVLVRPTRSMWKVSFKVPFWGLKSLFGLISWFYGGALYIIEYMWHVYNPPFPFIFNFQLATVYTPWN